MSLFSKKEDKRPDDAKSIRDALVYFIRQRLAALQGGEGGHITGIHIYLYPEVSEKMVYESAVYFHQEERMREEIQQIAEDFALDLPEQWSLQLEFVNEAPADAIKVSQVDAAVWISTRSRALPAVMVASLRVLEGEAEETFYTLKPGEGRINIGRDKKVNAQGGFLRENRICFLENSNHPSNKFISRQHAHIEYDETAQQYYLYADEGGIPPRNKVKVKRRDESEPVKLQNMHIPYLLMDGDQIVLGETALLEFSVAKKI